jgi:hypothetical protein
VYQYSLLNVRREKGGAEGGAEGGVDREQREKGGGREEGRVAGKKNPERKSTSGLKIFYLAGFRVCQIHESIIGSQPNRWKP